MTGPEFAASLNGLGLTQARFAELVRCHPTAVYRWAHGQRPVPSWVDSWVGLYALAHGIIGNTSL